MRLIRSRTDTLGPCARNRLIFPHRSALLPKHPAPHTNLRLPVLLDVESPLKLQMRLVVVVDELGDSLVVASGEHAGGCRLGLDWVVSAQPHDICTSMNTHTSSRRKASPRYWVRTSPAQISSPDPTWTRSRTTHHHFLHF